ncbi:unnamed protein product [Cuscuta epithymum]|uniref:LIM zinc-binding domain-containing protein n=1 Tax=Cuscuta epithymum TaxID=186058 RepID=A0AAV0EBN7_9ASTE|nr:unnamed protein product [Cuscuta epithymum]
MSWVSKLFKGNHSSEAVGSGQGQQPEFLGEENMVWRTPFRSSIVQDVHPTAREKDELERAIALSMAEGLKQPTGNKWREGYDEDVPLHFRGGSGAGGVTVSLPTPPFYLAWAPKDYCVRPKRICNGCYRDIGYRNYLGCMGSLYHPECFRCHACNSPIKGNEYSLSGNKAYHMNCFKELSHPRCEVCHQFIPADRSGLIEYKSHPFWGTKYCPSHEHDSTARCCSCERLESWKARYVSLGDGRSICCECLESAIMDTGDCQPLYHSIRHFYEGLYMKIDQQIPMILVERQALNEAIVGERNGSLHMSETRGLCLSEEQTVSSIQRKPRMGGRVFVGMRTQPLRLTRRCEVTAILILYGLPRLLTGTILAHELMHAWLRLNGYRNMDLELEEGICQVLAYMWLESEVTPGHRNIPSTSTGSSSKIGRKSAMENKLGEFFKHQILHDATPAYGDSYRAVQAAVNKYGLRSTLAHINMTGALPI